MKFIGYENVGARLRALRTQRRYSQKEVGALVGLSQNAVSNLETGHTRLSLDLAVALAAVFGVSLDALVAER